MLINHTTEKFLDLGKELQSQLTEEELNRLMELCEQYQITPNPEYEKKILLLFDEYGVNQEIISESQTLIKKFEQDITNISNTFSVLDTRIYDEIEYLVSISYVPPNFLPSTILLSGCVTGCNDAFAETAGRIYRNAQMGSVLIIIGAMAGPFGAVLAAAWLSYQVHEAMDIARGVRMDCLMGC